MRVLLTGDLFDQTGLRGAVSGVDGVIHLAALTRVRESFQQPDRCGCSTCPARWPADPDRPDQTRVLPRAVAVGRVSHVDVYGDGSAVRDFVHVAEVIAATKRVTGPIRAEPGWHPLHSALDTMVADQWAATR